MSISMRVSFLIFIMTISARAEYENSCETLSSEIHLVKVFPNFSLKTFKLQCHVSLQEEYTKGKELVRTCEDDVDMSKCEGYCVSTTTPSAMDK